MAKKQPPPNVARLTPDEQISYLFHQYEGFADWRIGVDEKLRKVDALDDKVGALTADFSQLRSEQRETGLGVREILLFLKGQQTPGLERPGLTHDFHSLQSRIQQAEDKQKLDHAAVVERQTRYDTLHARIGWILIGFGGVTGIGGIAFWPKIIKIIELLK